MRGFGAKINPQTQRTTVFPKLELHSMDRKAKTGEAYTRSAEQKMAIEIANLNLLDEPSFVALVGPIFEHSPWIAQVAWSKRPFASIDRLHSTMREIVASSDRDKHLDLIRAHPDLVGRAALEGKLTSASKAEQASAGLGQLSGIEIGQFKAYNAAYREKFGFPFVICARLNKKEAILKGFEVRLRHARDQEIQTALEEIYKIAYLRLQDIVEP
jgi:2-oxo-4-hydroxy-4-carboxy-5-ureidoimidazoline decarboxylase